MQTFLADANSKQALAYIAHLRIGFRGALNKPLTSYFPALKVIALDSCTTKVILQKAPGKHHRQELRGIMIKDAFMGKIFNGLQGSGVLVACEMH